MHSWLKPTCVGIGGWNMYLDQEFKRLLCKR